jgi:hypothetical protein
MRYRLSIAPFTAVIAEDGQSAVLGTVNDYDNRCDAAGDFAEQFGGEPLDGGGTVGTRFEVEERLVEGDTLRVVVPGIETAILQPIN